MLQELDPSSPIPSQVRVTIETLDCDGSVQRTATVTDNFPSWAQGESIERCFRAASTSAAMLVIKTLPVFIVITNVDVFEVDPMDYNPVTCRPHSMQEVVQCILTSSLAPGFIERAAQLGVSSFGIDENSTGAFLDLIDETDLAWKQMMRGQVSAPTPPDTGWRC